VMVICVRSTVDCMGYGWDTWQDWSAEALAIWFTRGEAQDTDEYKFHMIPSTTDCYTGAYWPVGEQE
jgi:hypothetical protein